MEQEFQKVIAVDSDGCLCHSKWPEIGPSAEGMLVRLTVETDTIQSVQLFPSVVALRRIAGR